MPRDEKPRKPAAESVGRILDDLCDQFEAACRDDRTPRIEDVLGNVSAEHRRGLLSDLLAIEIFWRRKRAERLSAEDYCRRFPEARGMIERQFAKGPPDPSGPAVDDAPAPHTPPEGSHATEASPARDTDATGLFEAGRPKEDDTDATGVFETSAPQPENGETAFFDNAAAAEETLDRPRDFGSYRILEELGRGGMGVVYRAWQQSADRYVALKLIRRDRLQSLPRSHQASVIHRFQHEAQAAGRIQHDHIVTVYEVGELEGEHFFSMRYVEGKSLTDRLADGPLDGHTAARYLEPVARAVHEAHLHGILHRDLKPQNILIDEKTDRALVADFGLAKLAEGAEEMTQAGDVMGSPPYMPPEQARDSSRVTAKSDVYSLGATLYHAITGRAPFQADTIFETIRQVAEETPLPLRQLDRHIDRDLETICLKCLEKDPARRYASAEALADELARYLNHEPILARPLGPAGRTIRWCRRYPVVAGLLACTVLFFFTALIASTVGYYRTKTALAKSEMSDARARRTVDYFFTEVAEEDLFNQPGLQPLRKRLLGRALEHYEDFAEEHADDPAVRNELAKNAYRLGQITEILGETDRAELSFLRSLAIQEGLLKQQPHDLALQESLGDTLNALGNLREDRRDWPAAGDFFRRAIDVRAALAARDPADSEWQRKLANSHMNLAVILRESGDKSKAESSMLEAQAIRREILDHAPENHDAKRDLAMGCYNLANLHLAMIPPKDEEALRGLREAVSLFEELLLVLPHDQTIQNETAIAARQCGDTLTHLRQADEAMRYYRQALDLVEHLAYLNPSVPEYRYRRALILIALGLVHAAEGPPVVPDSLYEAQSILQALTDEFPETAEYRVNLAEVLCTIAVLAFNGADLARARECIRQSRVLFDGLCEEFPARTQYRRTRKEILDREAAILAASPPPPQAP